MVLNLKEEEGRKVKGNKGWENFSFVFENIVQTNKKCNIWLQNHNDKF